MRTSFVRFREEVFIYYALRGTQRRFPLKCMDNTYKAIRSTFGCLKMHSKRRYRILFVSVRPSYGNLSLFETTRAINFRCNLTGYESEMFSDFSLHCIFESENFRFPFPYENSLTWQCEN